MKNIGIYKFYKDIYIDENTFNVDTFGYSAIIAKETWNFINILKRKANITILSSYNGKYNLDDMQNERFDKIIVFSGKFSKDKYGEKVFKILRKMTDEIIYIAITIKNEPQTDIYKYVDKLYAQMFKPYGRMYHAKSVEIMSNIWSAIDNYHHIHIPYEENKTNLFYYDTNDADAYKRKEIFEFIYRPGFTFYIRGVPEITPQYASIKTHEEYLKNSKFTFVTNSKKLYQHGLVSARVYENIFFGVLTLMPLHYDKYHFERFDNELRVKTFSGLLERMNRPDEWRINKVRELKGLAIDRWKETEEKILQMCD
jgi:hypothetical protein